jgi:hypothetical protein
MDIDTPIRYTHVHIYVKNPTMDSIFAPTHLRVGALE